MLHTSDAKAAREPMAVNEVSDQRFMTNITRILFIE